jgi:hypothetical protein
MTSKQNAYAQLHANSARLQASVLKLSNHLDRVRAVHTGAESLAASMVNGFKAAEKSEENP